MKQKHMAMQATRGRRKLTAADEERYQARDGHVSERDVDAQDGHRRRHGRYQVPHRTFSCVLCATGAVGGMGAQRGREGGREGERERERETETETEKRRGRQEAGDRSTASRQKEQDQLAVRRTKHRPHNATPV